MPMRILLIALHCNPSIVPSGIISTIRTNGKNSMLTDFCKFCEVPLPSLSEDQSEKDEIDLGRRVSGETFIEEGEK